MKEHVNFYENLKEAHIRLRSTIVLYDGEPYHVLAITDHKKDGIFRMYVWPIGERPNDGYKKICNIIANFPSDHPLLGGELDQILEMYPNCGVLRKQMNSPKFNKFRPFPLGMVNIPGKGCSYVERQPNRSTPQGLTQNMLYDNPIRTAAYSDRFPTAARINITDVHFKNCIKGIYPEPDDCIKALLDPEVRNEAAGFHRQFAFARGPLGMMFLAYKEDIVGVLPKNDLTVVRLGRDFRHVREVVQELDLFDEVLVQTL